MKKSLGLYIHIPFCLHKCPYCDFYSTVGKADYRRYTDALMLHMEDYSDALKNCVVDTIYIGGGTPSVLPVRMLCELLDAAYDFFDVDDAAEVTMEANPATLNRSALKRLNRAGVNRLSIGVQSTFDNELKALGRVHTYAQFEEGFHWARDAGFENISVDLMYGIPEQTADSLSQSLETITDLLPEHISLYGLKLEPETPFGQNPPAGLPDDDDTVDMYLDAVDYLASRGYRQYEISNFALEGRQSRHNLRYWNCEEYLGLGPGAHSYLNGQRFSFKRDTKMYITAMSDLSKNLPIIDEQYTVSPDERIGEYVMLRLRLNDGVDTSEFYRRFGVAFETLYGQYLEPYISGGYMFRTQKGYALTPVGMCVSNEILSTMLSFDSHIVEGIADGTDK